MTYANSAGIGVAFSLFVPGRYKLFEGFVTLVDPVAFLVGRYSYPGHSGEVFESSDYLQFLLT